MNSFKKLALIFGLAIVATSCQDDSVPNYQYMPNMYESVGYEAYSEADFLPNQSEAMLPPANTINRGWLPYEIENSPEGKELARLQSSPLDSMSVEKNLAKGSQLYTIYCAICHGDKGDGQGTLVKREKILGVPSYADPVRNLTVGSTYYTIHYGLNSMGSYASQMNTEEMWQVSEYVMKLKQDLTK
ncbi:MAG TPA: cytochrome c [Maribacter sp.]|uniref:Cytochrome C oxidase, cbb3-type, subunit III n=1 Tax=Maribacter dokdonensis TaxID=320912 RepID=A0ABY0USC4_9FLAO|nr:MULTISPECIES: cytochrome c [Maribacter]CAG2533148.1 Cytochrome C oxidase [Maribacter dokdonensis]SDT11616.1 Cytochrome C oxidase, cbb3-type, subunit III [Maribacter dokdonensis]HAF78457.1 cytochrome c [Maribacter sp.]|tara:strand:+ start:84726 stop:85286 length:561 start_codon:yes stop_codon:yes gene_type:complete